MFLQFLQMGYDRHVEYHSNGGANVSIEVEDSDSDRGANSDYDDDDIQVSFNLQTICTVYLFTLSGF